MEDNLSLLLKEYGLDLNEIRLYAFLVGNKEASAYKIAKNTKIHKSTCYDVLERLIIKGFVSCIEKNNKKFYSALDINQTITKLKDKENILLSILPEVEKIKRQEKSKVSVFENKDSQKQFNLDLFNKIKSGEIQELLILSGGPAGFIDFGAPNEEISSQIFLEKILREIKKSKLQKNRSYRGIWNEKFKGSELLNLFSGIGEDRFLKDLPTKATIVIYNNSLCFLFRLDKGPQVIEINNSSIADEMKAYFNYLWTLAKKG
jgi:predicted transcriptional regulator